MFERFTQAARVVVEGALVEASTSRAPRVGTEHLLLALLADPATTSARTLAAHGLDLARARSLLAGLTSPAAHEELDADALRAIGIDLDEVRRTVEAAFGAGTLSADDVPGARRRAGRPPFAPRTKKVLELALREAIRLKQRSISDAHLLLGLLREREGLAAQVLHEAGVDPAALRADLEQELRQAG